MLLLFLFRQRAALPEQHAQHAGGWLENYICKLIETYRSNRVTVTWQGGEPILMGVAGEPDIKVKQLKGHEAGDKTFKKVHINGYNVLPYLLGEPDESPRSWFFYANDDGQVINIIKELAVNPCCFPG